MHNKDRSHFLRNTQHEHTPVVADSVDEGLLAVNLGGPGLADVTVRSVGGVLGEEHAAKSTHQKHCSGDLHVKDCESVE